MSLSTFKRAKKRIEERGLITLDQGGRGYANKTRYRLSYQDRCSSSSQDRYQGLSPLYNNKQKLKHITVKMEIQEKGLTYQRATLIKNILT